jgi:D-serine deaminase-like pyridoxal phosphate-dependent protein
MHAMKAVEKIQTPAALIDLARMQRNIDRMQQRMITLGVSFRPHVKTAKCVQVARAQRAAGAKGITVSALKEAEYLFDHGFSDILYAVGMVPAKLPRALALRRRGCDFKIMTDNANSAVAIGEFGRAHAEVFEVFIEIDTDGHRCGIKADDPLLLEVARAMREGGVRLGGVLTHAGSSYEYNTQVGISTITERVCAGGTTSAR